MFYCESDEEAEFSDSEESEVEECEKDITNKKNGLGQKRKIKPKNTNTFDHDNFDRKVAISISNIHRLRKNEEFRKWVKMHYQHLQNMYSISKLECDPLTFYKYVYECN